MLFCARVGEIQQNAIQDTTETDVENVLFFLCLLTFEKGDLRGDHLWGRGPKSAPPLLGSGPKSGASPNGLDGGCWIWIAHLVQLRLIFTHLEGALASQSSSESFFSEDASLPPHGRRMPRSIPGMVILVKYYDTS